MTTTTTTTTDPDRAARAALRFEINADSGIEDVRTWALSHAFDVLELMSLLDLPIPDGCEFTFAMPPDWDSIEESASASLLYDAWHDADETYGPHVADAALAYWARVLTRYLALPAVAALAD